MPESNTVEISAVVAVVVEGKSEISFPAGRFSRLILYLPTGERREIFFEAEGLTVYLILEKNL